MLFKFSSLSKLQMPLTQCSVRSQAQLGGSDLFQWNETPVQTCRACWGSDHGSSEHHGAGEGAGREQGCGTAVRMPKLDTHPCQELGGQTWLLHGENRV